MMIELHHLIKSWVQHREGVEDHKIKITVMLTEWYLHQIVQKFKIVKKFKGYLRYKTITSPNVSYEAQIKNFFIS